MHGYVLKGVSGLQLVAVIRKVHSGQAIVTAELLPHLLIDARERKIRLTPGHEPLSHREQQVLQHVSLRLSNKEIAELLGLKTESRVVLADHGHASHGDTHVPPRGSIFNDPRLRLPFPC